MAQYWCDLYLWEAVLNYNPQLKRIIELGTWLGGFSLYLQMQANIRDMWFITYDSIDFNTKAHKTIPFVRKDIFACEEEIGEQISSLPTILLCDNGNKAREIKTFSPYLTQNSILVVHDWMTEVFPDDIPDYLEEVYGDFCDEIGSISRVFRKKVFH
jgi:hypothetical protein